MRGIFDHFMLPRKDLIPTTRWFLLIALNSLLLMVGLWVSAADAADSGSEPVMMLFSPIATPGVRPLRTGHSAAGHQAIRLNRAMADLPLHARTRFTTPDGTAYDVIYDNRQDHPSGNVTWSGYLQDYGDGYRVVITFGAGGTFGRILTPEGELLIESDAEGEWLVDPQAAGRQRQKMGNDIRIPPSGDTQQRFPQNDPAPTFSPSPPASGPADAATALTTIDVMILYTPGLAARLGNGLSARLDQLVALSNQAYRDSGVFIDLRLVHSEQVDYSDETTNGDALEALTKAKAPAFAAVPGLRNAWGADLVSLIRPFNNDLSGSCGNAWLNGEKGRPVADGKNYGYSVVSDGNDVNGSRWYCTDLTFTHELGHNMGSAHDRAHAEEQGAYPYSYGYGVDKTFGTIMSYLDPEVAKFSNPGIICAKDIPCGIDESAADAANNALSLNNTRQAVAGFRNTQVLMTYALVLTRSGEGRVISDPAGIDCGTVCAYRFPGGTEVALTAQPAPGFTFTGWNEDCVGSGACNLILSNARTVGATFTALPRYQLTVTSAPDQGTVTSSPAGINCGTTCTAGFAGDSPVTLTATPREGYLFNGWSGACTGNGACTLNLAADTHVTATFSPAPRYLLTVKVSGKGTVTSTPAGIDCGANCVAPVVSGTAVTLSAVPFDSRYGFTGWKGACTDSSSTCVVTMDAARKVKAIFRRQKR